MWTIGSLLRALNLCCSIKSTTNKIWRNWHGCFSVKITNTGHGPYFHIWPKVCYICHFWTRFVVLYIIFFNRLLEWGNVMIWTKWFWSFMLSKSSWRRSKSLNIIFCVLKLIIFIQSEFLLASYIFKTFLFLWAVGIWPTNYKICYGIICT